MLELVPSHICYGECGGVILPPPSCWSIQLMCGKAHLLCVSTSCGGQLPSDLAEPVICDNRLRAAREHEWVQPQETGKVVDRGWRWWVVVGVLVVPSVLENKLHQSVLLLDQLSELRGKLGSGLTSRRHLMGVEGRD